MSVMLAQAATSAANNTDDFYLLLGFILLGVAVILLALELFVPSGGLIAMLAGVLVVGSVISFFKFDTTWGLVSTASYVVLTPIVAIYGFKLWLNSPIARGMILGGREPGGIEVDEAAADVSEHARQERLTKLRQLIGAEGTTVTPLHPVGTVKINGQRLDAMAESGTIESGTPVIVSDVYDNQIKVRPKDGV